MAIVVNICFNTVESTKRLAQTLRDNSFQNAVFELANELFLTEYDWCTKNGTSYAELARPHALAIKEILPKAQIAICTSSAPFKSNRYFEGIPKSKRDKWNAEVSVTNQSWFDAVIVHMYGNPGVSSDAEHPVMFHIGVSNADSRYDYAMAELEKDFPEKPVWVTEYGLQSSKFRSSMYTSWFGGLYRVYYLMKLLLDSRVTLAHFHSLSSTATIPVRDNVLLAEYYQNDTVDKIEAKASMAMALDVYGRFVEECTSVGRLSFDDVKTYAGAAPYRGTFSGMEGIYFECGGGSGNVVIVNKLDNYSRLANVHVEESSGSEYSFESGHVLTAKDKNWSDRVTRTDIGAEELNGKNIEVPPYSITVLSVKRILSTSS